MNEDPTLQLGDLTAPARGQSFGQSSGQTAPIAAWGSFKLLARVGAGGFGEVYRAWDPVLQREVALKLLLPGSLGTTGGGPLSDDDYDSVLREARALASVRHPNIVAIYGVDRHEGRVGLWTDFIRGKTLSDIVGNQGPFGYREAALIGLDIARALAAVHRAGLLHRDIKPENVMREEGGRILLMDFGLSTLPHRSGEFSGTLNYMAHELFHGAPSTVASDIYAAGILLYYLVTATFPVRISGLTIVEASQASLRRTPLIDHRSDLPESFIHVVNRAIDLDPARRFHSAGEMAEALAEAIGVHSAAPAPEPAAPVTPTAKPERQRHPLRSLLITAIVLLFVFGKHIPFIARLLDRDAKTTPATNPATRANSGSYDTYLKAQSLLTKSYKPSNVDTAAEEFKQLTQSDPSFAPGWSGLGAAQLIRYLNTRDAALLEEATTASQHAVELEADSAAPYITLARIAVIGGNNAVATTMAQTAIKLDPTNSDAFRAMAAVLNAEGRHGDAVEAMKHAIDLNPDDWRAPINLGSYYLDEGKLPEAAEQFQRSAQLAPENRAAFLNLSSVDMRLNKLEEARTNITRAIQIEPDPASYEQLAWLLIAEGKSSEAVEANKKAVALDPNNSNTWANLGATYLQVPGAAKEAQAAYRKAVSLAEQQRQQEPKNAELLASLAYDCLRAGEPERSQTLLRQALAIAPDNPKIDYLAGDIYEVAGNRAKAIDFIVKSIGPGYSAEEIERDPDLASLRKDPAFKARLHTVTQANKN